MPSSRKLPIDRRSLKRRVSIPRMLGVTCLKWRSRSQRLRRLTTCSSRLHRYNRNAQNRLNKCVVSWLDETASTERCGSWQNLHTLSWRRNTLSLLRRWRSYSRRKTRGVGCSSSDSQMQGQFLNSNKLNFRKKLETKTMSSIEWGSAKVFKSPVLSLMKKIKEKIAESEKRSIIWKTRIKSLLLGLAYLIRTLLIKCLEVI